ncbi:uncharacterized protein LOC133358533 isoform X2 [Lethenteron reissneri]|uniref:uncharacterized protein LOC133358533 isoform X2 n=1 Tax=Lethenteron reissneri TaxID=7753 RepID=UPI002AB666B4|nr:uncharacterized protein LOC133358533 isoform X2 [Lethenteron reissneri]
MGVAFPDTAHYYSWAELSTQGIQLSTVCTALATAANWASAQSRSSGVTACSVSQELLKHIALGHLYEPLHFTYNLKTGYHNAAVIRKCIELLDARALSFPEIRSVALAFTAYDHLDQKGIEVEERTLIRALKMCGRITAPRRLMQHIHSKQSEGYVEPGRIQMYEFMDLLPLCVALDTIHLHEARVGTTEKSFRGIYELDDMKALLMTLDAKRLQHMNKLYRQEQRAQREQRGGSAAVKTFGGADEPWKQQMEAEKSHHQMLKQQLQLSAIQLRGARTRDSLRTSRPTTAPMFPSRPTSHRSLRASSQAARRTCPRSAAAVHATPAQETPTTPSAEASDGATALVSRQMTPATEKMHLKFADAVKDHVTSTDEPTLSGTHDQPEKGRWALKKTLGHRFPGYRDHSAPRPLTAPAVTRRVRSVSTGNRTTDAWERLMSSGK